MPKQPQSFGEQAARFSLYAPLTVLVIGLVTAGNRDQPGVAIAVASINMLLIAAGLILGVVALFSMRRYGREHILGRAIGGLLFNGLILVAIVIILAPWLAAGRMKNKVVGHWHLDSIHAITKIDLSLDENGQFTLKSTDGAGSVASVGGHWIMTPKQTIGVTIERVSGAVNPPWERRSALEPSNQLMTDA